MNELEVKFANRWNDYLKQCRESARKIDGEQNQFRFHKFLGRRRTRSCARSMNRFDKVKEKMDNIFTPETVLIEFFS